MVFFVKTHTAVAFPVKFILGILIVTPRALKSGKVMVPEAAFADENDHQYEQENHNCLYDGDPSLFLPAFSRGLPFSINLLSWTGLCTVLRHWSRRYGILPCLAC